MAEMAQETSQATASDNRIFTGSQRNSAIAVAMFATAALAFSMNLTHTFFATAMAWTFVLWGGLLLYSNLLDVYQTYELTDSALHITNALRPWGAVKQWDYGHIHRLDLIVKRVDAEAADAIMQVYYTPEGEITIEREDRAYNPELARLIIERAGLKATDKGNPNNMAQLPHAKATYIWTKSGRGPAVG